VENTRNFVKDEMFVDSKFRNLVYDIH
jgi:hypothetical protein